jgi:hypothetical protein
MSVPARPQTGDGGVRIRRGPRRWAWRLFWPEWHQELLALALIIITVAAGWLLARR